MKTKAFFLTIFLTFTLFGTASNAAPTEVKTFGNGSYQWMLNHYKDKPFVLIIWSITCPSCLKEMPLISKLSKEQPGLNLVLLSVDDKSVQDEIDAILKKHQLQTLDNWVFAEDNSPKLRYEIDPKWYGELPRTYFFNASHQRHGISGLIPEEKYRTLLQGIQK